MKNLLPVLLPCVGLFFQTVALAADPTCEANATVPCWLFCATDTNVTTGSRRIEVYIAPRNPKTKMAALLVRRERTILWGYKTLFTGTIPRPDNTPGVVWLDLPNDLTIGAWARTYHSNDHFIDDALTGVMVRGEAVMGATCNYQSPQQMEARAATNDGGFPSGPFPKTFYEANKGQ